MSRLRVIRELFRIWRREAKAKNPVAYESVSMVFALALGFIVCGVVMLLDRIAR